MTTLRECHMLSFPHSKALPVQVCFSLLQKINPTLTKKAPRPVLEGCRQSGRVSGAGTRFPVVQNTCLCERNLGTIWNIESLFFFNFYHKPTIALRFFWHAEDAFTSSEIFPAPSPFEGSQRWLRTLRRDVLPVPVFPTTSRFAPS